MKNMERIEQKFSTDINIVARTEMIYIEQSDIDEDEKDVVQIEKQSIPALIDALKKFVE